MSYHSISILVCYTAVFSVVTQCPWGGALREDTKNGCVADYINIQMCHNTSLFVTALPTTSWVILCMSHNSVQQSNCVIFRQVTLYCATTLCDTNCIQLLVL